MKKSKILATLVGLGTTAALGSLLVLAPAAGCSQPQLDCRAARGDFAVKFVQQSGTCTSLSSGFVGLQSSYPRDPSSCDVNDPNATDCKQDYDKVQLAIQSEVLGYMLWNANDYSDPSAGIDYHDNDHKPYGLGEFRDIQPDGDDLCYVPALSSARQDMIQIVDPADPSIIIQPPQDITTSFSNVKLLVTTATPGTIFSADLAYEETIDGVSCSATYKVMGVWPPVYCEGVDAAGDPAPDDSLCKLTPETSAPGAVLLNKDYFDYVVCDPDIFYCVPSSLPPGL
ncbi:MAG: hypothetical protein HY908_15785 [Myxococcales bacterium]|nr:hypothetical protein [Myxococcales bacterium]